MITRGCLCDKLEYMWSAKRTNIHRRVDDQDVIRWTGIFDIQFGSVWLILIFDGWINVVIWSPTVSSKKNIFVVYYENLEPPLMKVNYFYTLSCNVCIESCFLLIYVKDKSSLCTRYCLVISGIMFLLFCYSIQFHSFFWTPNQHSRLLYYDSWFPLKI